jgi:ribosomal protein S18 acetylase RimI-like enzyme
LANIAYRKACIGDAGELSKLRGNDLGERLYWENRISGYLRGEHHPQKALKERVIFLAEDNGAVVGFVAGHLTKRYDCEGELQWIDVLPAYRRNAIASQLLRLLAKWFTKMNALSVCVNVSPENVAGQGFYRSHGAQDLNRHWLLWPDIQVVLNTKQGRPLRRFPPERRLLPASLSHSISFCDFLYIGFLIPTLRPLPCDLLPWERFP